MCLIIKKPAGRRIDAGFLDHVWSRNSDGWGTVHVEQGRLVWHKGLHLSELQARNRWLPEHAEAYLHLRKATYGAVTHDMAHPCPVRPGLLLMHNGSLHHLAPPDRHRSDTAELARLLGTMLDGLDDGQAEALVRSEGFARLMAPAVEGSMVLLLDARGVVRLGRDWHRVQPHEWAPDMHGIEVSNTHAWGAATGDALPTPARQTA